jgi:hypothetical protein
MRRSASSTFTGTNGSATNGSTGTMRRSATDGNLFASQNRPYQQNNTTCVRPDAVSPLEDVVVTPSHMRPYVALPPAPASPSPSATRPR